MNTLHTPKAGCQDNYHPDTTLPFSVMHPRTYLATAGYTGGFLQHGGNIQDRLLTPLYSLLLIHLAHQTQVLTIKRHRPL
jgi:hypothetical protein